MFNKMASGICHIKFVLKKYVLVFFFKLLSIKSESSILIYLSELFKNFVNVPG